MEAPLQRVHLLEKIANVLLGLRLGPARQKHLLNECATATSCNALPHDPQKEAAPPGLVSDEAIHGEKAADGCHHALGHDD